MTWQSASELAEAGAKCLRGRCVTKIEDQRSEEEIIDGIESKIRAYIDGDRPRLASLVREFSERHRLTPAAVDELSLWICDRQEPLPNTKLN